MKNRKKNESKNSLFNIETFEEFKRNMETIKLTMCNILE